MSGWNPPPAPGGPPGPYGYGAPAGAPYAPPPRRSSGGGLIIVLLVGGFVAVVAIVVVLVLVVVAAGSSHRISTPTVAGGMSRDTSVEGQIGSMIRSQKSILRRATSYSITDIRTAVYSSGSRAYLFVGGNGDYDPDQLYSDFNNAVDRELDSNITAITVPLSNDGGAGEGACASISNRSSSGLYLTALCAWATDDTVGMVMPVPQGSDLGSSQNHTRSSVASVMRDIRDDVEETT